jgi:flagellar hook-associated protein 3 FlgL
VRAGFISTASLFAAPRTAVGRMQVELAQLSKEISTGRMADVGLSLGAASGQSVRLHIDTAAFEALIDSNGTLAGRLSQSQAALDQIRESADRFLAQLVTSRDVGVPLELQGGAALAGFIDGVNASDGHDYLFGGINSAVAPLSEMDAGSRAAIDAAFLAKFGMTQDDPLAADIDAVDMQDFLDNEFAALFADPDWGTTWSIASDQVTRNRISPTETVATSVSANQPAMRKLAVVYTMIAELGTDRLGAETRKAVIDKAIGLVGEAITGVTVLQQDLGTVQNRVKAATERLTVQGDILETRIGALEGVDPMEAKVRIDTLTTQIEMSYALTVRFLQMSILNYA